MIQSALLNMAWLTFSFGTIISSRHVKVCTTSRTLLSSQLSSEKLDRTQAPTKSYHQPFIEKKPHPVGSVRYPFNFYFYFYFYFARARAFRHAGRLAGSCLAPAFFKHRSRSHRHGYEHRDLGLHSYPCARLRIWSRETVPAVPSRYRTTGSTLSVPY